jgi:hypothetical protein
MHADWPLWYPLEYKRRARPQERELLEERGRTKERKSRGVGGRQVPREEIGSRTAVKLFSKEKSVETYKIYIL